MSGCFRVPECLQLCVSVYLSLFCCVHLCIWMCHCEMECMGVCHLVCVSVGLCGTLYGWGVVSESPPPAVSLWSRAGALRTHPHPSSGFQKALSVGVSLLALPLGTRPVLLPWTGGVSANTLRAPPSNPLHKALSAHRPDWSPPLFWGWELNSKPLSLESNEPCWSRGQEIPTLSAKVSVQLAQLFLCGLSDAARQLWNKAHLHGNPPLPWNLGSSVVLWPLQAQRWDGGGWWRWVMKLLNMCAAPHPQLQIARKYLHTHTHTFPRWDHRMLGWGNWCPERVSVLPKDTQQISGRTDVRTGLG